MLVLVAVVATLLFFGVFREAVRRNPNRPGAIMKEEERRERDDKEGAHSDEP